MCISSDAGSLLYLGEVEDNNPDEPLYRITIATPFYSSPKHLEAVKSGSLRSRNSLMKEDKYQLLKTLRIFLENQKENPSELCHKILNYFAEDSLSLIDINELLYNEEIDICLSQLQKLEKKIEYSSLNKDVFHEI